MQVKFKRLNEQARLPCYAHADDAGMDLYASEALELVVGARGLVRTGLQLELPPGSEGQVRPRSGLAFKHGVTVLNAPGTIDAGYRGELCVLLINLGAQPFMVEPGMRIAQLVIAPVVRAQVVEVTQMGASARGTGGFGSTGHSGAPVSRS